METKKQIKSYYAIYLVSGALLTQAYRAVDFAECESLFYSLTAPKIKEGFKVTLISIHLYEEN